MAAANRRDILLCAAAGLSASLGCMGLPTRHARTTTMVVPPAPTMAPDRRPLEALQSRPPATRPEWDRPGGLGEALSESRKPGYTEPAGPAADELVEVQRIPVAVARSARAALAAETATAPSLPSDAQLRARRADEEVIAVGANAEPAPTLAAPRPAGARTPSALADAPKPVDPHGFPPIELAAFAPEPAAAPAPKPVARAEPKPAKAEPFRIGRLAWCDAVLAKGRLDGETATLVPGRTLLLYAEAAGFGVTAAGEATLSARLELHVDGQPPVAIECAPVEGPAGPERELYCHFEVALPDDLPAGPCRCVLRLHDRAGNATADATAAAVAVSRKEK